MKDLKDKAIDIKGKKYVLVSDRVQYFNEKYPKGCILTDLLSEPTSEMIVMRASVYPEGSEGGVVFTGHSQAVIGDGMVNTVAALENAETSAVGRALGFMGIGVIDSIASVDEMNKAGFKAKATEKQIKELYRLCRVANITDKEKAVARICEEAGIENIQDLTPSKASDVIGKWHRLLDDVREDSNTGAAG